jgi:transposase
MTRKTNFKMTSYERSRRTFSDNFKKEKVREIELGRTKVAEICKQYEVSATNVYRWIAKFASMKEKKERIIVESQSDTKELLTLKQKIAELERIIGQKQILLDFKDKMIDIAEEMYGVDIKKKLSTTPSASTGSKEDKTPLA